MVKVVSVKFNPHGKSYFFDPNDIDIKQGDTLIVETSKGLDIGECAYGEHYVTDDNIIPPLRPVIRVATGDDLRIAAQNKEREKEAFEICKEKIAAHGLEMKLVDVECGFEGNKILFFFTADGRVDFRDLVKDLASVFRTRIELRQIGVRDETKMLGGLGICGRPYCCSQFLNEFQPVSTKMAKTQNMSLNPTKISGSCGRLMCCLRYEQEAYEELIKKVPKTGAFVQTPYGYGNVLATNVLRQKVKVCLDEGGEQEYKLLDACEVAVVPGGRPKPGEPLPQVLGEIRKKEEAPEPEIDIWEAPCLFAEDTDTQRRKKNAAKEKTPSNTQKHGGRGQEPQKQKAAGGGGKNRLPRNAKQTAKQPAQQNAPRGGQHGQAAVKQKEASENPNSQKKNSQNPNSNPNPNRNKKRRYNRPKPKDGGMPLNGQ